MAQLTPETWAATLLKKLGIHQTPGAVQALVGWAKAEGGHWNNDARYNPLNTTQNESGAKSINSVGVKSYGSLEQGLQATVETLRNGRYNGILHALSAGDPSAVANAVGQTPWGTNAALVRSAISSTPRVAGVHALGVGSPQNGSGGATSSTTTTTTTRTTPGVDNSQQRLALTAAYLANTHNPDALTALAAGLLGAKDAPAQTVTSSSSAPTRSRQKTDAGSPQAYATAGYPTARHGKVIGTPYTGTHTIGNWQSDNAVDIAVPVGTPMVALQDGVVVKVRHHPQGSGRFAGDQITIRGANGNEYFYAHGVASVKPGQRIKKGQSLGTTGSANGVAHLHFGQMRGDPRMHAR